MKKELEEKLFNKHKKLFPKGKDVDPRENLMYYGYAVGDGWYKILDELFTEVGKLVKDGEIEFVQVKEKFGGLRIYYDRSNEEECDNINVSNGDFKTVRMLVEEAEEKSYVTCEHCGKKGELRKDGWYITLCDDCHNKKNEGSL